MSERLAGSAIFARLTSTAGTAVWGQQVYDLMAPEEVQISESPYVVYQYVHGGPINRSPTRIEDLRFDVKCMAHDLLTAKVGQDYIDAAFHQVTLTIAGFTNWATQVVGEISLVDNTDANPTWIKGKQIRIRMSG